MYDGLVPRGTSAHPGWRRHQDRQPGDDRPQLPVPQGDFAVSQVGIAGSCTTGDYVVMAGQVGLAARSEHWRPGRHRAYGAGLHRDVAPGQRILLRSRPTRERGQVHPPLPRSPSRNGRDLRTVKQMLGLDKPPERAAG